MAAPHVLLTGLAFGESPRWHEGRLWVSDWGAQQVLAVDLEGRSETVTAVPSAPACIDFLPDGRLLVVSGGEGRLLRREADGTLATHADLAALSPYPWNDIVVDEQGRAFVNTIGFEFGGEPGLGSVAVVGPDGRAREVADGLAFPNGMVLTPDSTLVVSESYANRLTAFDVAADASLSGRRVWADLGDGVPDGICLDADGAVWYADVPHQRCVRVSEGGEVLATVELDRGGFACMLGGPDGRTLFIVATRWTGAITTAGSGAGTGQVLTAEAPAPRAGRP